jgi:hypothetical protein
MSFAAVAAATITGGLGYLSSRSANRTAQSQADAANALARQQGQIAQEQWDVWKTGYLPMEQGMLREAQNFDSPARREAAAAQAIGDVNRQFGLQRDSVTSRLQSFGVDPSNAKYGATFARLGGAQGAAAAGTAGVARRAVEQEGWGRRFAMAGIGRNLMSSATGGLSSAAANLSALSGASSNAAQAAAAGAGQFMAPFIKPVSDAIGSGLQNFFTRPGYGTPSSGYVPMGSLASTGVDPYGINGG